MNLSTNVLNNDAAAAILGIKGSTLKFWRHMGKGPRFVKLGDAKQAGVAYIEADVLEWRDARKFNSTSAYSPAALANRKSHIRAPAKASG
jgi:predicted DNA-binding transcriptional regulator AlpA